MKVGVDVAPLLLDNAGTARYVRGVVGVSGVYRVDDLKLDLSASALSGALKAGVQVRPEAPTAAAVWVIMAVRPFARGGPSARSALC